MDYSILLPLRIFYNNISFNHISLDNIRSLFTLNNIYNFIYHLIHKIFYLLTFVSNYIDSVKRLCTYPTINHIYNISPKPHHIVFVIDFDEDYLTLNEIALLIKWSSMIDIEYISLYDVKGVLCSKKEFLEKELNSLEYDTCYFECKYIIKGTNSRNYMLETKLAKSKLRILSDLDMKQVLVTITKYFISKGQFSEDSINPDQISEILEDKLQFPDPDLAIICSPILCTYGLLPWHIRTTEIISLHIFKKLRPADFIHALYKFSKREQRHGR